MATPNNNTTTVATTTATAATTAHILVYPFLNSGHIIPILDLTHKLLNHGLAITILITPENLPLLDPLFSRHEHNSASLHSLVLPTPENLPSKARNPLVSKMMGVKECHYKPLLDWFRSHPSPPIAILSDFFLGWTQELAEVIGIKRVVFSPSGLFSMSVVYSLWTDQPENKDPSDMNLEVSFPRVPGCPKFPWYQISELYRGHEKGELNWEFLWKTLTENLSGSWGMVFNSFDDLEKPYIDYMKKRTGNDQIWAVGPILPPDEEEGEEDSSNRGGSSSVSLNEVMKWLDECNEGSVVYVCFGSHTVLTTLQMGALAAGLELSCVNFVWCVRQKGGRYATEGDRGALPKGFLERVSGRGFVIEGWAPQVAILRHKATGAFLSHCGWNSVLEGIAAGVVMLTWPMRADQFNNAKLLVEGLSIGISTGQCTRVIPEPVDLARILNESIDKRRPERARVRDLSMAALCAVKGGGSSSRDLEEFVRKIKELAKGENSIVLRNEDAQCNAIKELGKGIENVAVSN